MANCSYPPRSITSGILIIALLAFSSFALPSVFWAPPRPLLFTVLLATFTAILILPKLLRPLFNPSLKRLPRLHWLTLGVLTFGMLGQVSCSGLAGTTFTLGPDGKTLTVTPPEGPLVIPLGKADTGK